MNTIEDGGSAFPLPIAGCTGMSLRDYFAAKMLPFLYLDAITTMEESGFPDGWREGMARDCYRMADAMLKAREQQP